MATRINTGGVKEFVYSGNEKFGDTEHTAKFKEMYKNRGKGVFGYKYQSGNGEWKYPHHEEGITPFKIIGLVFLIIIVILMIYFFGKWFS